MRISRLALALTAAVAVSAGAVTTMTGIASAGNSIAVSRVQEANISDQSFSLSWMTATKVTQAAMYVGTSCKTAKAKSLQVPGSNGFVHLANAPGGLNPNSTYWVKLSLNGAVQSACYRVHTYPTTTIPPPPNAVYGSMVNDKTCKNNVGHTAIPGSLVVVDVRHNGGASDPLATIADSKGHWAVPFGEVTNATGQFQTPVKGDLIEITGWQDKSHNDFDTVTYDGSSKLVGPWTVCIEHK